MASSTFLVEFRKFCQTTSVRGVPRIINSKSLLHSVIWALAVVTCASLLCWQMTVIFKRYFSYGFNTVIVRSPDWDNATFPDITVCNLFPLVNDKEMNLSYTDYINILKNEFTYEKFKNTYTLFSDANDTNLLNSIFATGNQILTSASGYFLNFPLAAHFGSFKIVDTPLVAANYFGWDYSKNVKLGYSAYLKQRLMPNLYKCYTIALGDALQKQFLGFSAIFYVDDFLESLHGLYELDLDNTEATGMQVMIHTPGSAPDMTHGIPAGTGMSTTITLEQTKVTHLAAPYSNCTTQTTIGDLDTNTAYTEEYCIEVCLQQKYFEKCGCLTRSLLFSSAQLKQSNGIICGNASINDKNSSLNWDGVFQLLCAAALDTNQDTCKRECLTPCHHYQYFLSASAAPWPHKAAQIPFYRKYIQGSTSRFGNQFDIYEAMLNNSLNTSEINILLQKADQEGIIKNHFLQLNIQFVSSSFLEQKDVADFSFDAFGAQVGGVLSLWLGVTVILVFELCEVVINLLMMSFWNKRTKKTSSDDISNTKF